MKPQPKDAPIGGLLIGIDTGGTFTDVVMLDTSSGRRWVAKTASTPEDPSIRLNVCCTARRSRQI